RRDAKSAAGLAHASFEHHVDAQLGGDLANVHLSAFERKRGRTRCEADAAEPGQGRDQFLGEAITEVLEIRLAADVRERENCNGGLVAAGFGPAHANGRYELISAARDRRDIPVVATAFTEGTPESRDVL